MSRIIATGSSLPKNKWSNNQFIEETKIDSSDEWIQKRTGIKYRYIAGEDETVLRLASDACEDLFNRNPEINLSNVQLIVVATMSSLGPTPSIANQLQAKLGIEGAWGFDLNGACSGFVMALDVANKMSSSSQQGYTLVVGVEKMSNILNFQDRSTSVLFGDGAGAVLIEHDGSGLTQFKSELKVVGANNQSIQVEPVRQELAENKLTMDGHDVFNFVNRTVISATKQFVDELTAPIDYLLFHQANVRLIQMIGKKLKLPSEKIPVNIDQVANTSAASIPILLDELVKNSKIPLDGSKGVLFSGFGGGLAYGNIYTKL